MIVLIDNDTRSATIADDRRELGVVLSVRSARRADGEVHAAPSAEIGVLVALESARATLAMEARQ